MTLKKTGWTTPSNAQTQTSRYDQVSRQYQRNKLLTPKSRSEAPPAAATFDRFLDLPRELRDCIYREVFGECSVVAALDTNGSMRIAEAIEQDGYDRGEWEDEYNATYHNKSMTARCQIKTTPSLLFTCRQIHDEAKTVLQDSTWFTFTITEPHIDPEAEDSWVQRMLQAKISTFLPWMKHAVISISAPEVEQHWSPVLGEAWLENWFRSLFHLLDTQTTRLQTLGLEMSLNCIHDPCVMADLDDLYVQGHSFYPILDAWRGLRFPGVVQLEPVKDGVFCQFTKTDEQPGYCWTTCYPTFWRDFSRAENSRLVRLRHPEVAEQHDGLGLPLPKMYDLDAYHRREVKAHADRMAKSAAALSTEVGWC